MLKKTPPKLTQPLRTHAHLKVITAKTPQWKEPNRMGQDLRNPNINLPVGIVLISGKKDNLLITKEYILKDYSDIFSAIGTLPGDEYHFKMNKDYKPVQHPPRSVPFKLKPANKEEL